MGTMPRYVRGHRSLVDAIERRVAPFTGLRLAGNSYRGVGIPDAIGRGQAMADEILASANRAFLA